MTKTMTMTAAAAALLVLLGATTGTALRADETDPAPPAATPPPTVDLASVETSIVGAVDEMLESVVGIEVEVPVRSSLLQLHEGWPFGSPLQDPFGLFGPQRLRPDTREAPEQLQRSGGSGVIHSADGLIVTNNHVVQDAKTIRVTLHGGEVYDAELVGADPESHLAVIRIDADGLPAVRYADVDSVRPGQFAIAVGMPFNLDYTVTVGHVSALGRAGLNPQGSRGGRGGPSLSIQNFIQTDTVINPGNSGGPLVNLRGEVIGINSIVHGGIGGGFGFAIPPDLVQRVAGQLIEHGETSRAWLGLSLSDLTWEKARAFGIERVGGAVVEEVHEGGPASKRIKRGDVIVAVDGEPVNDSSDLVYLISSHLAGEELELTFVRDGREKTARVEAGERRSGLAAMSGEEAEPEGDSEEDEAPLGMVLEELTAALNERLGRPDRAGGVLVRAVTPGSAADRADLSPGDVIVDVDGKDVDSPAQVRRAVSAAKRDYVPLTVERAGRRRFVALEKGGAP